MPFCRPLHHSSRQSPSPNITHPSSGFCSVSSWGTESSPAWFIFNSSTAVLFFPDPPTSTDGIFDSLEGFTAPGEVHWQDSTQLKWAPKQGPAYRHNAVGAGSRGGAGKHCTSSCSNMPQGYMQSHILPRFLLANGSWVPGCCCIVCSRHTVAPQGTLLRTNIRKTWQNHKLIISPAGGFKEVEKHAHSNRADVAIRDLDCMKTSMQQ